MDRDHQGKICQLIKNDSKLSGHRITPGLIENLKRGCHEILDLAKDIFGSVAVSVTFAKYSWWAIHQLKPGLGNLIGAEGRYQERTESAKGTIERQAAVFIGPEFSTVARTEYRLNPQRQPRRHRLLVRRYPLRQREIFHPAGLFPGSQRFVQSAENHIEERNRQGGLGHSLQRYLPSL